jgi:hypothetical protein
MEPPRASGGRGVVVVVDDDAVVLGGALVDGPVVLPLEEPLFEYDAYPTVAVR